jgi:hypothetical protein
MVRCQVGVSRSSHKSDRLKACTVVVNRHPGSFLPKTRSIEQLGPRIIYIKDPKMSEPPARLRPQPLEPQPRQHTERHGHRPRSPGSLDATLATMSSTEGSAGTLRPQRGPLPAEERLPQGWPYPTEGIGGAAGGAQGLRKRSVLGSGRPGGPIGSWPFLLPLFTQPRRRMTL